jgi:hypothetical protein
VTTASPNDFSAPRTVRDAFQFYLLHGFAPLPGWPRSKATVGEGEGIYNQRARPEDIDELFPPGQPRNIGCSNGAVSGNLADLDLDSEEAVRLAPHFLPATSWRFRRQGARDSAHWIYRSDPAFPEPFRKYLDPALADDDKRAALCELRGTGHWTIWPPSVHPDGAPLVWESLDDRGPPQVPLAALERASGRLAAAALLARHWPARGNRDDAAMALSGGLTRAGWAPEEVDHFVGAVAEAAGDEEARTRAHKADRTAAKLSAGGDVTGWPTLANLLGACGDAVVSAVRGWLDVGPAARDPAVPEPPPWPDPLAEEAFHGLPGRIVRTIEPSSEADPAALLVQTLVAFGSAVGRGAYFAVEGDRHHANEFAVLVGRTSKARKGTSWGRVHSLLRQAAERWATERVQSGLSSGEGLIWAVRDPITKRERVKERGEQVRYEEVEADPGVLDKRLLVYEPEFANVLKQTERQGNTVSVVLRQAWDGQDLRTMTKNSPARAAGAHVSLIGHITADELRRYLTQTETANGFGNRHLWVCADRSKLLPEGGRVDAEAWAGLGKELEAAIEFARGAGEVSRDDEARAVWLEVYAELSEGRPGLAGALLARAEAHVMRLAMLYALLDRSALILAPHLIAALALWEYVERSVYHVFGDSLGDPVADELLRLLRSCPGGMTRSEVGNHYGRHQPSERIGRALGLLLQHRLARFERQETGGRPVERWFATRGRPR